MPTITTGRQSGHVQIMRGVTERERRRDRQSGRGTPLVPTVFSAEGHQNGVRAALLTDAPLINQERTGGSPERGKSSFNLGNELPRFDSSPTSTRRDYSPMPGPQGPLSTPQPVDAKLAGRQGRDRPREPQLLPRTLANFGRNTSNPASPHRSFSPPKIAWVARPNIQGPGSAVDTSRQKTTSRPRCRWTSSNRALFTESCRVT